MDSIDGHGKSGAMLPRGAVGVIFGNWQGNRPNNLTNWFMKSTLMTVLLATALAAGCSPSHKFRTSRIAGIGNSRCTLSEKQLSKRRNQIARLFEQGVRETRELPDGFEFRFASDDSLTDRLFEFVQAERQCCGFLTFELTLEPKPGPVWLRLRGDSDAKRSIREMIDSIGLAVPTTG